MKAILPLMISQIMIIGVFSILYFAYGESDFYLEAKVNKDSPYDNPLNITRLEFQGNASKSICHGSSYAYT